MEFEFISFYTENTPYEKEADELRKNLLSFGFSADHVCPKTNLSNWHKNCCHKPYFIDEKLKELDKPVVWIDADARIIRQPILFEKLANSDVEFSVHFRDNIELLSGTMFLRPTDKVMKLIYYWKYLLRKDYESPPGSPQYWKGLEQSALQYLVTEKYSTFKIKGYPLPKGYVHIDDLQWWSDSKNPVIVHGQASRRYKRSL